jgi:hypothetical protein
MPRTPTIAEPPVKAKPSVDMEVLASIHPELMDDSYVYIHCHFDNHTENMLIRIWRTTFIIDKSTSARGQLIHAENISYAPQWTMVPDHQPFSFLLIFPRLPKSCTQFDMIEEIDQPGGFWVKNIQRNETDVYHVDL